MKLLVVSVYAITLMLQACNSNKVVRQNTLSALDLKEELIQANKPLLVNKDQAEKAYKDYLNADDKQSTHRKNALQRLAEIQLDMKVSNPEKYVDKNTSGSIELFKKRLVEYPNSRNNDVVMYQLANAYAVAGNESKKVATLERLVDEYPESEYFVESMFRLGESYLTKSEYIDAELALTSVIIEDSHNKYKNNALFKRAWSKYKQLRYSDAINDYNQLLQLYPDGYSKNRSDQELLNNIYKVYSACISYIGINNGLADMSGSALNQNIKYYIYENLASFLTGQDRLLDAASVYETYLRNEISRYSNSILISLSNLWLQYDNKEYSMEKVLEIESKYGINSNAFVLTDKSKTRLSDNLIVVSEYYHSLSQKNKEPKVIKKLAVKALDSYSRLIKNYQRSDMSTYIYQYAELLQDTGRFQDSLHQYEAAFSAAKTTIQKNQYSYALLALANKLFYKKRINRLRYNALNATYLKEISTENVYRLLLSYAEYLYNNKEYVDAVSYIEENKQTLNNIKSDKLKYILASSYFEIGEFTLSEKTYRTIKNKKNIKDINKRLALAIFKQAEQKKNKYLYESAIDKFTSIGRDKLDADIDLLARIEISSIYLQLSEWKNAISTLIDIRKKYPTNKFNLDITQKLSVGYLNDNQDRLAAVEFEKIASNSNDTKVKRSAIWQAAELYETGNDKWSSIRAYKKYINTFKTPISLHIEAQNKLSTLYSELKLYDKRNYWLRKIINYANVNSTHLTDRIKYLASNANLLIARDSYNKFMRIKLTVPLQLSLRKKKQVLKNTVNSLQKVNKYKMYDHISESIYWIAETYYSFSQSLLKSERPGNLTELELEQYDVLLEDQAIPFEDQAIRYFLQNIRSTRQGLYSPWVGKSFEKLSTIYPTKFKRQELISTHINQFY